MWPALARTGRYEIRIATATVLLLVSVISIGCASDKRSDAQDIERFLRDRDPTLKTVKVTQATGWPGRFVAICDWEDAWWGTFACVTDRRGHLSDVTLEGEPEQFPTEQSIAKIRALRHSSIPNPLVEVFGMTHMGNGSCYLYEWQGDRLRPLLNTWAVDSHDDGRVIRGGFLNLAYEDVNADGHADAVFTGIIDDIEESGEKVIGSHSFRKVAYWNPDGRSFDDPCLSRSQLPVK